MNESSQYIKFLRNRITELRLQKNISEHRMSLELGKGGSYIRSISSGTALPSIKELFNIINYLGITPSEFFYNIEEDDTPYVTLYKQLQNLSKEDIEKVLLFVSWIKK